MHVRSFRRAAPFTLVLAASFVAAASAAARPADAQPRRERARRDTADAPSLPAEAARTVTSLYNAPGTTRVTGRYDVPAGRTIEGDVAVLGGPVTIGGTITGRLTAVNADVTFRPGARVNGDVFVVGGVVDGRTVADLRGELRIYRQPLTYRRDDDRIEAIVEESRDEGYWWRLRRGSDARDSRTYTGLTLTTGGTYNRVEGLPIHFGPSLDYRAGATRVRLDALGIFRTAEQFAWDSANIGHLVRGEVRYGRGRGVRLGGRLYDQVAAVEEWQLGAAETGVASFLLRRDFRDYYNRHGGALYASLFADADANLTVTYADERWAARNARDVFTLLRNGATWRPNPAADEGRLHRLNTTLRVDTRNDEDRPWAGWYVEADYERGQGDFTRIAPTSANLALANVAPGTAGVRDLRPGRRAYGRGFLDLRRYNRLGPDAQLNFRVVGGGWLHGDELPLQRRFSVTGPGALPGFDFRRPAPIGAENVDVGQCATFGVEPAGTPAQCDRMVLTQVEYRGDIRVGIFGDDDDDDGRDRRRRYGWRTDAAWVVFANAGRGWLVGDRAQGDLVYRSNQLPQLSTFLTDVGVGLDFGSARTPDVRSIGIYVAKSVTGPNQAANVFLRIRRRF